jgi:hypothetical protein
VSKIFLGIRGRSRSSFDAAERIHQGSEFGRQSPKDFAEIPRCTTELFCSPGRGGSILSCFAGNDTHRDHRLDQVRSSSFTEMFVVALCPRLQFSCVFFMKVLVHFLTCFVFVPWLAGAADAPKRPINLLFIITDQQRWDTLGCSGNTIIKTPNLDRLAHEGARFTKMYSSCPVCVPARTVILTGRSCGSNQVTGNEDFDREDLPTFPTFDQILIGAGYHGEYHGKWHCPYKYALDYSQPVRWSVGKKHPAGPKADLSESEGFLT